MKEFIPHTFTIETLTDISEKTIEEHIKLYNGYVKNANLILQKLEIYFQDTEKYMYEIGELRRRFSFEFDGMRNHEHYFHALEGGSQMLPTEGALYKDIEKEFGSYESWFTDFQTTALTRGIGWAILYYDKETDRLLNTWVDEQHLGHLTGLTPVLALDMWEHAYYIDYTPAEKKKYIQAFFDNINWNTIEQKYKK